MSVKPIPLREIAVLGFDRLKLSDVVPFKATLAAPKTFEIAGGDVTGGGGLPDADAPPPQAAVQNKLEAITKDKDTQRGSIQKAGASRSSFFLLLVTVWHFIVLHLRFNVHLAI